jgi:hypothetical protein
MVISRWNDDLEIRWVSVRAAGVLPNAFSPDAEDAALRRRTFASNADRDDRGVRALPTE